MYITTPSSVEDGNDELTICTLNAPSSNAFLPIITLPTYPTHSAKQPNPTAIKYVHVLYLTLRYSWQTRTRPKNEAKKAFAGMDGA